MGYLLAAYGVVFVTLSGYTLWLRGRRRELEQRHDADLDPGDPGKGG